MNTTKTTDINLLHKIFMGMLVQLGTATTLDVKTVARKLDPDNHYAQNSVSKVIEEFANKHGIYYTIAIKNGNYYRVYECGDHDEMRDLYQQTSDAAPVSLIIYRVDKDISTVKPPTVTQKRPPNNQLSFSCGEYGKSVPGDTVLAHDKNSARASWSSLHGVLYRDVYARQIRS